MLGDLLFSVKLKVDLSNVFKFGGQKTKLMKKTITSVCKWVVECVYVVYCILLSIE